MGAEFLPRPIFLFFSRLATLSPPAAGGRLCAAAGDWQEGGMPFEKPFKKTPNLAKKSLSGAPCQV
ncbi:MAG: hypothetical protein DBX55_10005 [Verrucomicrobia bacterium]|nr:MAG: hypothetical protein DBX55_10005 [Verrucomicrobiota bacterium]